MRASGYVLASIGDHPETAVEMIFERAEHGLMEWSMVAPIIIATGQEVPVLIRTLEDTTPLLEGTALVAHLTVWSEAPSGRQVGKAVLQGTGPLRER